jgi:hypothetical protein
MIKIIYRIFKKQLNKLVFEHDQLNYDWRDKCDMVYVDIDGLKYYRFRDVMDTPIQRYQYLLHLLQLFMIGFNKAEYSVFLKELKSIVDVIINDHKESGKIKELTRLITILNEIEFRANILLDQDILFEMVAVSLIEENENPATVDHKSIDIKVKKFKAANEERAANFFIQAGLNTFIPFLELLKKDWMKYMTESSRQMQMSNEVLGMLLPKFKEVSKQIQNNE